jgi:hypothetical protein
MPDLWFLQNWIENRQGRQASPQKTREEQLKERTIQDFEYGLARGRQLLSDDPRVSLVGRQMEDLAKGYSGRELGALREQAADELAGQRSQYLRQLASRAARGGVGGARAAAMQAAADQGFLKARAEQERKMALDNAQLRRQGIKDYSDFLMRQRFGELATGTGLAALAQAAYAQASQEAAARESARVASEERSHGLLGGLFRTLFG